MSKQKRTITGEDLAKIKGLGAKKAEAIEQALASGSKTAEELAALPGVSERLAAEVVKLVGDPSGYTPEAPTPRKKATRKAPKREVATNGAAKKVTADDVRAFARQAEEVGFSALAKDLREQVAPLLGSEVVDPKSLALK